MAGLLLLILWGNADTIASWFQPGFTDNQVRQVEQTIKEHFVEQMSNSPSAVERHQIATGSTTIEVRMVKMSAKRLEGFATFSLQDEESKNLGLGNITIPCEATMGMNRNQWIWKCQNK